MAQTFTVEFQGLPRLQANLRRFRFEIRAIIEHCMLEAAPVLISPIQDALVEGDYVFKHLFGGQPTLYDSIVLRTRPRGANIQASIESTVPYAEFFEEARPRNTFPSGKQYERVNIERWLILKKGEDPQTAKETSYAMIRSLEIEDNAFRFPDPVIQPTAEAHSEDYVNAVVACVQEQIRRRF